jgi:endonuclease/exonuclease/phosphatase family metal-dependent hydrolase
LSEAVKLMTYNIYDGAPGERRELVTRVIAAEQPDVLVLCECNDFERDGQRALHELEQALDMRGLLLTVDSGYHLALFVRRMQVRAFHRLSGQFQHGAFLAELSHGGRELSVIGTHLCPFGGEARLLEARRLAARVQGELALLGDLNALSPHDAAHHDPGAWLARYRARHQLGDDPRRLDTRALSVLEQAGLQDLFLRAHPGAVATTRPTRLLSDRPAQRLDYVLATAPLADRLQDCRVVDGEAAQLASDHLPVIARLA